MNHNPRQAKTFIALMTAAGVCSIAYGLTHASPWHPAEALALFAITVAASRMKVKLPGLSGNMSVNLPFLLLAVAELNLVEALAVACASMAVQCLPKDGTKAKPVQMLFNISSMAFAVALGWQVFHHGASGQPAWLAGALLMPLAVACFFLIQTVPVSIIIALTDGGPVRRVWTNIAQMTFPYYVLSAGMAFMVMAARQHVGWQLPLLLLPVMYGTYCSYQMYFGRNAAEPGSISMAKGAAAGR
jgi:hypothetical protein